MAFKNLIYTFSNKQVLSISDILASSGLNNVFPELSMVSLKIKRASVEGGKLSEPLLNELTVKYESMAPVIKKHLDNICDLIASANRPIDTTNLVQTQAQNIKYFSFDASSLNKLSSRTNEALFSEILNAEKILSEKSGPGNEFLGWLNLPLENITDIEETAEVIRKTSDAVVFVGIGGSYLGAKAVISALHPENYNQFAKIRGLPEIYFAGHNLSTEYMRDLLYALNGKRVTLIPISKSGTTTEPAVAFRILKEESQRMGLKVNFIAITDRRKGALKIMAAENKWKTFDIADDIGGRFSVLSPVGLLPIAISGLNIREMLNGAKGMMDLLNKNKTLAGNPAIAYSLYREAHHLMGKDIEILSCWSPYLTSMTEWWKQLYGESEGKDGKGIFVASTTFTTDLHSLGQQIQDGKRNIMETFLYISDEKNDLTVKKDDKDLDGLNYLDGKSPDYINTKAFIGTKEAHEFGSVPTFTIALRNRTEETIGALLYFFEYACGISCYFTGVNPFNQPGVEEYKKRMFKALGKK